MAASSSSSSSSSYAASSSGYSPYGSDPFATPASVSGPEQIATDNYCIIKGPGEKQYGFIFFDRTETFETFIRRIQSNMLLDTTKVLNVWSFDKTTKFDPSQTIESYQSNPEDCKIYCGVTLYASYDDQPVSFVEPAIVPVSDEMVAEARANMAPLKDD